MRFSLLISILFLLACQESQSVRRVSYGTDENQFFALKLHESVAKTKQTKLVILAHGGGFFKGSYDSHDMKALGKLFGEQGYSVASLEYRLCPKVKWPAPLEDMAAGTAEVFNELKRQGIEVSEAIYLGSSAGATGGAYIFYGRPKGSGLPVDRFVSFGGIFSEKSLTKAAQVTIDQCSIQDFEFKFHKQSPEISALLFEGEADPFDANPLTQKGHAAFLATKLQSQGNPAKFHWIRAGGRCAHDCPRDRLISRDPQLLGLLGGFLGWPVSGSKGQKL